MLYVCCWSSLLFFFIVFHVLLLYRLTTRQNYYAYLYFLHKVQAILDKSEDLKQHPEKYANALQGKTLLMLFQKPSLRTRVSFETGMTQMGGHAIHYSIADSPLGVKETFGDTGKVLSRFVDIVMARVNKRTDCRNLADNSTIPIINALDDFGESHSLSIPQQKQPILAKCWQICRPLSKRSTLLRE